jgi:hypothetical protein
MAKTKPTPEPQARQLLVADKPATMQHMGAGSRDEWNNLLITGLGYAICGGAETTKAGDEKVVGAISVLMDMKPADPVEAMVISQMVAANSASLELYRRAWVEGQTFEARTRFLALADKSARTVATLSESLTKYRTRGRQTVVVQHVNVADGGQAVVAGEIGMNPSQT